MPPPPSPSRRKTPPLFALASTIFLLMLTRSHSATPEWTPARATYHAAPDHRESMGGACGYGDLRKAGYGMATVGVSQAIFGRGRICGACFQVRCVEELRYCLPGTSIVVTATSFCPPNYALKAEEGGHCNPPNHHLVMPIAAFEKIAIWKAGNMPIEYRRIKCRREGGIRFSIDGRGVFLSVLISNVGGAGDVAEVKIKGSKTGWLQMGRNWGQNWHINADLKNQPLSFEVTTGDGATLTSYNVAPKDWSFGRVYTGKQFEV